jgi:chemotaxis protein MotB
VARRRKQEEEPENDERWLLTYADMITLLMALFMVLFSISSVNKSKFESLQRSLKDAFSGRVLPGGTSIKEAGGESRSAKALAPPISLSPTTIAPVKSTQTRAQEDESFQELKRRIDQYAREHGLSGKVSTRITADGQVIRLLTDKLLFDSGSATPKPGSNALLSKLGAVLGHEGRHPVKVEGHTDPVPVHSAMFPTNWELSTARASAVVRALAAHVSYGRMTASGRAYLDPITSNDTGNGRALNRRVEILLPRQATDAPAKKGRFIAIPEATEGHP